MLGHPKEAIVKYALSTLHNLLTYMKSEFVSRPITALCELVNFQIPGQKVRPIANLIVERPDWFVSETKTALTVNETTAKSLLTPFLNVSIFDDRSLLSEFNSMSELNAEARSHIAKTLRRLLKALRSKCLDLLKF